MVLASVCVRGGGGGRARIGAAERSAGAGRAQQAEA